MTPAARLAATIEILEAINTTTRPADMVLAEFTKGRRWIGAKDRRALAENIWRVLRRRARLGWWLEHVQHPDRDARAFVLADLALETKDIPDDLFQGAHAATPPDAIDRRLIDILSGGSLFHHAMPAWAKGEYPPWMEPHLSALFGDRLAAEMGAMRDEAPLDLRVNTLKADRPKVLAALSKLGIDAKPTPLSPIGVRLAKRLALTELGPWRDGWVEVQDEGSQLVALITDAQPGQAVADYCAGAGGKTLALAACMENKGRLMALDVAEWRIDRAAARLKRAGVHNVVRRTLSSESDKWVKRSAGSFDRVLVDAPCTGTGTWRRNPDAKWSLSEQDIAELCVRQGAILASAARLVKPGGRLIYATCSLLPEENESQVEAFLASHPDYIVLPVGDIWPTSWGVACPVAGPYLRLSPLQHGTDGFFAAVLVRKSP